MKNNLSYVERFILLTALFCWMLICIFRMVFLNEMVYPEMFLIGILIVGEIALWRRYAIERAKSEEDQQH